jgi:hypothetical protein
VPAAAAARPLGRRAARAWLLACLAAVAAVFAPSLANTFALDDRMIAKAVRDDGTPNVMVGELRPLSRYFTTNYWQGIDDRDLLYRPVTVLSYAVLYALAGRHLAGEHGEALPQHAANLALHLLATWLAYLLARRVRVPRAAALVAAAVFGLHAIHSEVVAGVVGRAELLGFVFGALATVLLLHACRGPRLRVWPVIAAGLAFFLAFAAKESAVAWAPFAWVVLFVRRVRAQPARPPGVLLRTGSVRGLAAVVPPLLSFLALRSHTLAHLGADGAAWVARLEQSTAGWRLGNALVQWAYALLSCVLPTHLSADHGPAVFTPTTTLLAPAVLGSLVLLAAAAAAGLFAWRRQPLLFLAAATFFGHSFLTSNVPMRIGTDYAERLYYAPSLGLSFAAAWLALHGGRWRRLLVPLLAAWLGWNAWLILQRNGAWRDDPTLFAREVVDQPRSARMHLFHAIQLQKRGEQAAMVRHLEHVVELFPAHAEAWNHLGFDHFRAGRYAQARACFERSLAAGHFEPSKRVGAAINLVAVLLETKDLGAIPAALDLALATQARALAARVPDLRRTLGAKLPWEWFDGYLARAAAAAPAAQPWAYHRAWLAYEHKRLAAAAAHCRTALSMPAPAPRAAEMKLLLASSLAATGQPAEARQLADALLADPATPAGLRDSARELRARLP